MSGEVKLSGDLIEKGTIIFRGTKKGDPDGAGNIKNGRYQITCGVGSKRVEVFGYQSTGQDDGVGGKAEEQFVPDEFNKESELTIDVAAGSNPSKSFELEPKKKSK